VIEYEVAAKADDVLAMAHGLAEDMACTKAILGASNPKRVVADAGVKAMEPEDHDRPGPSSLSGALLHRRSPVGFAARSRWRSTLFRRSYNAIPSRRERQTGERRKGR